MRREQRAGPDKDHAYRPDIDGLRAVAVVSVVLYHAAERLLPGGFVGVDIFFVISGYLISKHIAAEIRDGRFTLAEFYRRRIRRIAPALLVVIAATLIAAALWMTPEDSRAVAKSAIWSIGSLANVHFWRDLDHGYFAAASTEIPLLHLWSLGVEEQYYVVWPLCLWAVLRKVPVRYVLAVCAVAAAASFQLAWWMFSRDAAFAYYMLPSRMGELLIGSMLGVAIATMAWRPGVRLSRMLGWIGAALILVSLVWVTGQVPFPGWTALPSTLGSALLILGGESGRPPLGALASRPMVYIGKISYSAYLWHWPLLAFYRYGYGEPETGAIVVILVATFLLGALSFRYVERPARRSTAPLLPLALRQFVAPAFVLSVVSAVIVVAPKFGLQLTSAAYAAQLREARDANRAAFTYGWACQRQHLAAADLARPECVLGAEGAQLPRVLLWGDSNATHYIPVVEAMAIRAGQRFRNVAVGSCPPVFGDPSAFVEPHRLGDCRASSAMVRGVLDQYPVVIIAASWPSYLARDASFLDQISDVLRELTARGQSVILLGRTPVLQHFDRRCQEKALRIPFKTCPNDSQPVSEEVIRVNDRLRQIAASTPRVSYFDGNRYLCPDNRCGMLTASGQPRYYDPTHLTVPGSRELAQAIVEAAGLPEAFAAMRP